MPLRPVFVELHRYVGLTLVGFLIVSGLTGSIIAFYHELDEWLNPEVFQASEGGQELPPSTLAEII